MDDVRTYKQEDIQRYLQHKMSATEMHAFEKAMMDDPFLADAIEGYKSTNNTVANKHLQQIERELRGEEKTKVVAMASRRNDWWKAAAIIFFMMTGALGYMLWNTTSNKDSKQIAQTELKEKAEARDSAYTNSNTLSDQQSIAQAPKPQEPAPTSVPKPSASQKNSAVETETKQSSASLAMREEIKKERPDYNVAQTPVNYEGMRQQNGTSREDKTAITAAPAPSSASLSTLKRMKADTVTYNANDAAVRVSPDEALQGRVAGVDARANNVRIRGLATTQDNVKVAQKEIKGKVIDASGKPIAGATVSSTSNTVTISDVKGNFTLQAPDSTTQVIVNSVGYSGAIAKINSRSPNNNVTLKPVANSLNEVVVIGYGTQKKKDVTGSVSAPRNQNLEKIENANVNQVLGNVNRATVEPRMGWQKFDEYVRKAIRENKPDTTGNSVYDREDVVLEFSIDEKGRPVNINIVRTGTRNDALKAIDILKKGPLWTSKVKEARIVYTFPFKP